MHIFARIGLGLLASVWMTLCPVLAEDFALAPGDEVDVSIFARPELSRIYRVRADGTISLHLIGAVQAQGRLPTQLEADIEAQLAQSFDGPVSATLEVSTWRPVTVSGDVVAPGSVVFLPGSDVRTAVAMAGGVAREITVFGETPGTRMRVQEEAATVAQLKVRLASIMAARARLLAEVSDAEIPAMPADVAELVDAQDARALADAHAAMLTAAKEEDQIAETARGDQRNLAREEAEAFGARQGLVNRQLDTTLDALDDQEDLQTRGLARASSLLDLRLNADRLRADGLEALGLEAAARQKVERAISGQALAEAERRHEIATDLMQSESQIVELRTQIDTSRAFVRAFGGADLLEDEAPLPETYRIFRRVDGQVRTIAAQPETPLRPGDVVDVLLALPTDG